MKNLAVALIHLAIMSTMTGCIRPNHPSSMSSDFLRRQGMTYTSNDSFHPKDPQQIVFYSENTPPKSAYKVIGNAYVANHNFFGIRRNETLVQTMLKQLAANAGGDGMINLHQNQKGMEGNVIVFQKILF